MKAAHPRDIIKRTAQAVQAFTGQEIVLRLSSGSVYRGRWLDCDASTLQLTLNDDTTGSVVWVDASYLESITFPRATEEMLAILSEQDFDPFVKSEKVGNLMLSRQIVSCSEELSSLLGQTVQVSFEGSEENLARVVLLDVLKKLTIVFQKMCSDEFSLSAVKKSVTAVKLAPSDEGTVKLENNSMNIQFGWKAPKNRWNERSLADALNKSL